MRNLLFVWIVLCGVAGVSFAGEESGGVTQGQTTLAGASETASNDGGGKVMKMDGPLPVSASTTATTVGAETKSKTPGNVSILVNNTTCPVLGEKIDPADPVTVQYNGKTYNLCCPSCIATFNSDPEKYAAIAEKK